MAQEARQIQGTAALMQQAELEMTPPTAKYAYRVAKEQPESSGYFTITNWT